MINDDDTPDPYHLPDDDGHPANIAARLMRNPAHAHLADNEVSFGWLMRAFPKDKGGKTEMGSVHAVKNMAQGAFKDLFSMMLERLLGALPDYVIVIDAAFWAQASAFQREALVWHELAHVRQLLDKYGAPRFDKDGLPVFGLVDHDITAFNSEVAKFGAWHDDIRSFIDAARSA